MKYEATARRTKLRFWELKLQLEEWTYGYKIKLGYENGAMVRNMKLRLEERSYGYKN